MIETEMDPSNEEVMRVAKEFLNCGEPVRCVFKWVSSNIGYAPNVFSSVVNAMGDMGKPYVAYTANVGSKVTNEVYDYGKDEQYTVSLSDDKIVKKVAPAFGYLTPIETSEQAVFKQSLPLFASALIGGLLGYALRRR